MTISLSTSNPPAPPAGTPPVASALKPPTDTQTRSVPGGVAGATGVSPAALAGVPSSESTESFYYFLESVQPTSSQVLPVANPSPPSLDPARRAGTVPATATAADPRGLQGRSAVPGQPHGSTTPVTPGIQVGAQPFAPDVPPASAFGPPKETHARTVPAVAAGAVESSPSPIAGAVVSDALPYFLEPSPPVSPGAVPAPARSGPALGIPIAGAAGGPYYFVDEARTLAGKATTAK